MSSTRTRLGAPLLVFVLAPLAGAQVSDPYHLFTHRGSELQDDLGASVAFAGDVDGDGYEDVALGAPQPLTLQPGYVRVLSGHTGRVLHETSGGAVVDNLGNRFGFALANAGDVDGDGTPDLVVGAPFADHNGLGSGGVSIVSGATGMILGTAAGPAPEARFGHSVAAAGDVDGDGVPDVVAGAPTSDTVRVLSGEWFASTALGAQPSTTLVVHDLVGNGLYGNAVAGLGDVDGDGRGDVAIGAPLDGGVGAVHVVSGSTGLTEASASGVEPGEWFGRALANAGDLDQDGEVELAVGAPFADVGGEDAGRVSVRSGAWIEQSWSGGTPAAAPELYTLVGGAAEDGFGFAVSPAGDPDGDLAPDLLVGAIAVESLTGSPYAQTFVGATGAPLHLVTGEDVGARTGWSLAGGGDVNGDGFDDVLVGAPLNGDGEQGGGHVISGRALTFTTDTHTIDLTGGGAATLSLFAGPQHANEFYFVVGSVHGTSPGIPTPVGVLPLVFDAYTTYTLSAPSLPEFTAFQGFLDANGEAQAAVTLPAGSPPNWTVWQLHYAYGVLDAGFSWSGVSNAVPVHFTVEACTVTDPLLDCNGNGVLDTCDVADGTSYDCNGNGVPDECDIAAGTSLDLDLDRIPDECQSVVFVDPGAIGDGTGSSWANAHTDLALAMAQAAPFTQLWVRAGTYRAAGPGSPSHAPFLLRDTVGVYGGFAGTETSLDQRDWVANPTVLSGDLNGDDLPGFVNRDDNAYSVVLGLESVGPLTVLDGFTVTAGYADEIPACDDYAVYFDNCRGGGIYALGSPTVRHCRFEDNYGGHHGGAGYTLRDPVFVDCTFRDNAAIRGGAFYADVGASPRFVSCTFEENSALEGGALYFFGVTPSEAMLVNCRVNGNVASSDGGAIWAQVPTLQVVNSTVSHNTAGGLAGAIWAEPNTTVEISSSILWGNVDSTGASESAQLTGGTAVMRYTSLQGQATLTGLGVDGADPVFADPLGPDGVAGTADDDLTLAQGSGSVDSGNSTLLPLDFGDVDGDGDRDELLPLDRALTAREKDIPAQPDTGVPNGGPVVDRGAYER